MFVNKRVKSVTYRVMESLYHRMGLNGSDEFYFKNQVSGHNGENGLDEFLQLIAHLCTIFVNMMLRQGGTEFEIDTILVRGNRMHLYDVKNYQGEYYDEDGRMVSASGRRVANPFGKLDRAETLMTLFLKRFGLNYEVSAFVVYINEEFTFHGAPHNEAVLFRSQIKQHLRDFVRQNNDTGMDHSRLIKVLLENNLPDYRSKDIPEYGFDDLRKGIWCPDCGSFEHQHSRQSVRCINCGKKMSIQTDIIRNAEEWQRLFPEEKLTTAKIYEWCGGVYSKQRITYALKKSFMKVSNTKGTYFIS